MEIIKPVTYMYTNSVLFTHFAKEPHMYVHYIIVLFLFLLIAIINISFYFPLS